MAKPAAPKKTKPLSKSEILNAVSDAVGEEVSKKHVKEVVEHLVAIDHKELKKAGASALLVRFGDFSTTHGLRVGAYLRRADGRHCEEIRRSRSDPGQGSVGALRYRPGGLACDSLK
jgi:nucleoid DNA-binding protein